MTDRPTKNEVDIALMVTRPGAAIGPNVACVLAAEVRALREELEYARQTEHHIEDALEARDKWHKIANEQRAEVERLEAENDRLRRDRAEALNVTSRDGLLSSEWLARTGKAEATIARVEALVEGYEAFVHDAGGIGSKVIDAYEMVIEEMRDALRGGP